MELTKPPTGILLFHVVMGTVALLSGAGALIFKKGSKPHRLSGQAFVVSMILMTVSGLYLAVIKPATISVIASILTFYLVLTSWVTVKRQNGNTGNFETIIGIIIFILGCVFLKLGYEAFKNPIIIDGFTVPYQAYFIFGSVAIFAGMCDINLKFSGGISGANRIIRHLWRMCFAFLIAATSIFQGNPQVFSDTITDTMLAIPTLILLVLTLFWIFRVRFTKWYSSN